MAEWPCSGLQIRLPRFDSGFRLHLILHMRLERPDARVVELVDTRDLKSLVRKDVPVQVRPRAPFILQSLYLLYFIFISISLFTLISFVISKIAL